jgi:hypothetical protein
MKTTTQTVTASYQTIQAQVRAANAAMHRAGSLHDEALAALEAACPAAIFATTETEDLVSEYPAAALAVARFKAWQRACDRYWALRAIERNGPQMDLPLAEAA